MKAKAKARALEASEEEASRNSKRANCVSSAMAVEVELREDQTLSKEEPVAEAIVMEAQGYELHLSTSGTGYRNVYADKRHGTYMAQIYEGGRQKTIGTYRTAVEAAVAVAKKRLGLPVVESSEYDNEVDDHGQQAVANDQGSTLSPLPPSLPPPLPPPSLVPSVDSAFVPFSMAHATAFNASARPGSSQAVSPHGQQH